MDILSKINIFNQFTSNNDMYNDDPDIRSQNLQISIDDRGENIYGFLINALEENSGYFKTLYEIENTVPNYIRFLNANNYSSGVLTYNKMYKNKIEALELNYLYLKEIADKIGLDYKEFDKIFESNISYLRTHYESIKQYEKFLKFIPNITSSYTLDSTNGKEKCINDIKSALKDILKLNSLDDVNNIHKYFEQQITTIKNTEKFSFKDFFKEFRKSIKNKNINYCSNFADKYEYYINSHDSSDTTKFLLNKQFEESIQADIELSKAQKNSRYILFDDDSMISFDKDGVLTNHEKSKPLEQMVKEDTLSFILRKKPSLLKFMLNKSKDDSDIDNAFILVKTIMNNTNILRNIKVSVEQFQDLSFESIDDTLNSLIDKEKLKNFTYSIISNKYKNLINEDTIEIFKEFYYSGFNSSKIQSLIGKKIAAFKTPEDFNEFASNVFDNLSGFKEDVILDKIELMNLNIVYKNDKTYVVEIPNYNVCKNLGSPQWCIVRDDYYFDLYTNDNSKQYFLFDFNKDESDIKSLIGFTLYKNGLFNTQHLKNDSYLEVNDKLIEIRDIIVTNEENNFKISKELDLEIKERNKIDKNNNIIKVGVK